MATDLKMRPLYIFDLDGTIALIEHRRHILDELSDPDRWRRFYALCDLDLPNLPIINTMRMLKSAGADIWIFSGRSAEVFDKTIVWLKVHTLFMDWDADSVLVMRDEGDYTPDDILKQRWFDSMLVDDRRRLIATFDDRDRVVAMYRKNGVACFQVAPGDF